MSSHALLLAGMLAAGSAPGEGTAPAAQTAPAPAAGQWPATMEILEHEAPVLAALERAPQADALSVRARTLEFPDEDGDTVLAVVADVAADGPILQPVPGDEDAYTQDFTILALIRDAAGQVVHKSSRHYVLTWSRESLEDVRSGRVLFLREALLGPGRYTVEVAARDALGEAMGVIRLPLDLPPVPEDQLRVSTLVIVAHAEPDVVGGSSPLTYEGVQLYPNMGDAVVLGPDQPLPFLFTVRPGPRALASATVELQQDGQTLLQSPVALPAPDATGQMRVVSGLPLGALEPGPYVLRLSVNNAQGFQTRSVRFTLGS